MINLYMSKVEDFAKVTVKSKNDFNGPRQLDENYVPKRTGVADDDIKLKLEHLAGPISVSKGVILYHCFVGRDCTFRKHSTVLQGVVIGNEVQVGKRTCIEQGCLIGDEVTITSQVLITHNTTIEDHVTIHKQATILNNCFVDKYSNIGARVTIQEGVRIGAHCVVDEGLTIPPNCIIEDACHISAEICRYMMAGCIVSRDGEKHVIETKIII